MQVKASLDFFAESLRDEETQKLEKETPTVTTLPMLMYRLEQARKNANEKERNQVE